MIQKPSLEPWLREQPTMHLWVLTHTYAHTLAVLVGTFLHRSIHKTYELWFLLIHLSNACLLNTYYMPGTLSSREDTSAN